MIKGTCVCPGTVKGKIKFFKENENYTKEDIVVMQDWLTQNVLQAKEAGALISKTGGITCHASIITRELNIPALISANIEGLEEGKDAIMQAEQGVLTLQ